MGKPAKKINIDTDKEYALGKAFEIFSNGGVFIYPTDTIYGIGCDPFNKTAMNRLNILKGRSEKKQYIFLINNIESLPNYVVISDKVLQILKIIWPAPLTAVLELNYETRERINLSTIAFRIPDHRFCLDLLYKLNSPLVSTSVNQSNQKSLTNINSISKSDFANEVDAIFYSLTDKQTEASTIVDLTGVKPVLIRKGQINFMEMWKKLR